MRNVARDSTFIQKQYIHAAWALDITLMPTSSVLDFVSWLQIANYLSVLWSCLAKHIIPYLGELCFHRNPSYERYSCMHNKQISYKKRGDLSLSFFLKQLKWYKLNETTHMKKGSVHRIQGAVSFTQNSLKMSKKHFPSSYVKDFLH